MVRRGATACSVPPLGHCPSERRASTDPAWCESCGAPAGDAVGTRTGPRARQAFVPVIRGDGSLVIEFDECELEGLRLAA